MKKHHERIQVAPNVGASDSHLQASLDPKEEEEESQEDEQREESSGQSRRAREESEKENSAREEDEGRQQVQRRVELSIKEAGGRDDVERVMVDSHR